MELTKLKRWINIHSLLIVTGVGVALFTGKGDYLALLAVVSFSYLIYSIKKVIPGYFWGGPANWVTAIRLVIVIALLLNYHLLPASTGTIMAILIVCLDGVDGWLARKSNTSSVVGGYFDKEVDAFFVMVLSLILYWQQQAGIWVLGLGLIRYVYVIPLFFFQAKERPESKTNYGSIIAGIVMIGLSMALALPQNWNQILLPCLGFLLLFSFGRSFFDLVVNRE